MLLACDVRAPIVLGMKKRVISAALWLYAGWTFGAMVATALSVDPILGPIVGAGAAILFVGDPRKVIWTTNTTDEGGLPA